ncbi:hypothetical protein [Sphingomonas sp. PAMC 26617]|uniref:hypothetical protein n=1 Tax=Sphingomonas sp. PAMC 26617 TaxID=1112216 RepID=UPI0012F4939F|nr:hypothetical protein [Sphingomonas sp. PAMC 26617]
MTAQFRDQHSELMHLAENILNAARLRQGDDLGRLRLAFARAVRAHVADEALEIAKAIQGGHLDAELVGRHNRLIMNWRGEIALCNSEWTNRRVVDAPEGFIRCFLPLVEALQKALLYEEQSLLAII